MGQDAELAPFRCPCEQGPVHLSPSQPNPASHKSAGGFRPAAGAFAAWDSGMGEHLALVIKQQRGQAAS